MKKPHRKFSIEARKNMSAAHKGIKPSQESINKRIKTIKGKKRKKTNMKWMCNKELHTTKMVNENDVQIFLTNGYVFGRLVSNETKEKQSKSRKGKIHSIETKEKQRIAKIGSKNSFFNKKHSKETLEKFKNRVPWNKGKRGVYSRETLKQMSESRKKLFL